LLAYSLTSRRQRAFSKASLDLRTLEAIAATWGRSNYHNFRRLLTTFGNKIGVFHKKTCYDLIFASTGITLHIFLPQFSAEKIITSVPGIDSSNIYLNDYDSYFVLGSTRH
jgi:hypothetical protein